MSQNRREHRPILAILLKFSSVSFFAMMGVCVKYLGSAIPVGESIAVRSAIGVVAIALVAWRSQYQHLLRTVNWRSHARRSIMGALAMFTWFMSLNRAPLADVTAMVFMGPIFSALFAPWLLQERIRAIRWVAVALGFCGVFIMTGPRFTHTDNATSGVLLALLCALFTSLSTISLRKMSATEHPLTTTFYFSLTTFFGAALTSLWGWPVPDATQCLLLLLVGIFGTAGQFCLSATFRYAEASTVVPVEYTGILSASLLGYVFFQEIPGVSIWMGAPLVIGAGLLILWGEYRPAMRLSQK